jgi:hypothetical protein
VLGDCGWVVQAIRNRRLIRQLADKRGRINYQL